MVKKNTSPYTLFGMISLVFLLAFFGFFYFYLELACLWSYLISINMTTFLLYGYDKKAALSEWRRVPEIVLHGLALFGGTPFAFLAQYLFRHKTVKGSFRIVFWLILIAQIALLVWSFFQK